MKYLVHGSITEAGQQLHEPGLESWMAQIGAWHEKHAGSGKLADASYQLGWPEKATTVRAGGVTDGPFLEAKEIPGRILAAVDRHARGRGGDREDLAGRELRLDRDRGRAGHGPAGLAASQLHHGGNSRSAGFAARRPDRGKPAIIGRRRQRLRYLPWLWP
jgi:hypothetical protein